MKWRLILWRPMLMISLSNLPTAQLAQTQTLLGATSQTVKERFQQVGTLGMKETEYDDN